MFLNIAPLTFSQDALPVGFIDYLGNEQLDQLRHRYRQTHAFRLDGRVGRIANVTIAPGCDPLGTVESLPIRENLLICGEGVRTSIVNWLSARYTILPSRTGISFWARAGRHMLLSRAIQDAGTANGQQPLRVQHGLDVLVRFRIDTRLLWEPGDNPAPYLGLVLDLSTSNVIDIPVAELIRMGVAVAGKYVCKRSGGDEESLELPKLETLGCVSRVDRGRLLLTDSMGITEIDASEALLEPRQENLAAVVQALYDGRAKSVLQRLHQLRASYNTAPGKLNHLRHTLEGLRGHHQLVMGGMEVKIGDFLSSEQAQFPAAISTSRPTCLFGAQGRNTGPYPDGGIQRFGPYEFMYHEKNEPLIVVVCEATKRARVEQFVEALRSGFPEQEWATVARRGKQSYPNPYSGGLLGKFHLRRIDLHFEEITKTTPQAYREAAERALQRLTRAPDLALVQTRQAFKGLRGDDNPYFVAKAAFMSVGVPVQAVTIENIDTEVRQQPYILNNIALASYAKLGGTPWVIQTRNPSTREIVVGMGYTEVGDGRLGDRTRFVGISTVFQGDGRYLTWDSTREVEFEKYSEALLQSLETTARYVQVENAWREGDRVRLIFHVYKPLKQLEMDAVKDLVDGMLRSNYDVEYAFLDLSSAHPFHLFDPDQKEVSYFRSGGGGPAKKGRGVPARGVGLQLDARTALLQLTGPNELKTDEQGVPKPLKIELHPDSDLNDLTYLVRQIYHFTYLSWQSFFPATEPVTILYSRWIARRLADLRSVNGWTSKALTVGSLRGSKWFL